MSLKATNQELERITMGTADGSISKDEVLAFFRKHVTKSSK